ncbi:MAG: DUF1624 domain-containing protein [Planctomycetes bacterium]|nr:DUF1624 domain-containing protein [Planctomycetota bacterium]
MCAVTAGSAVQPEAIPASDVSGRLASLDQFRGYTVAGMVLVNFIGSYAAIHTVFKHNDNYFSFADSIMPSFHFAVGCSYLLTFRRGCARDGLGRTYLRFVKRGFALVLVAILFFGAGGGFSSWKQFEKYPDTWSNATIGKGSDPLESAQGEEGKTPFRSDSQSSAVAQSSSFRETFFAQWRVYVALLLKSRMWNTFAIIGVTQLVVLPFIGLGFRGRLLALFGFLTAHFAMSVWFNWGFVLGDTSNWMVQHWKTGSEISWDGGFFGPFCWAAAMLAGSLAVEILNGSNTPRQAAGKVLTAGVVVMLLAYLLSCGTRFYDVEHGATPDPAIANFAASPFLPDWSQLNRRPWISLLAEPPFVAPPGSDHRLGNYWMMCKQIPTLSFILFASGFAAALFALFIWLCDILGFQLPVFRTFGTNPLAAYMVHGAVGMQLEPLVPRDSPLWYVLVGFAVFFGSTWLCVRFLERQQIYIRI